MIGWNKTSTLLVHQDSSTRVRVVGVGGFLQSSPVTHRLVTGVTRSQQTVYGQLDIVPFEFVTNSKLS